MATTAAIQIGRVDAFQAPIAASAVAKTINGGPACNVGVSGYSQRLMSLFATSDNEDKGPSKKRRKRKQGAVAASAPPPNAAESKTQASTGPTIDLKPRDDTPVQLEIKNVMRPQETGVPSTPAKTRTASLNVSSTATPATSNTASDGLDDSLEQLLEDAKRMKEEQGGTSAAGLLSDEEGTGVKEIIRNVLSTIVTADFFVVCGFLLWFLTGIFWRAVFNDDSVQIAFNNNFETLVQPALGVLMIAALAGNFFKDEENPDMMP
jgi:hypothetical protein